MFPLERVFPEKALCIYPSAQWSVPAPTPLHGGLSASCIVMVTYQWPCSQKREVPHTEATFLEGAVICAERQLEGTVQVRMS